MIIQVTQLRLNSNPKFANLTQLRLNSKPKFTNLTHDSSHFTSFGKKLLTGGGRGVRSNVAVGWFFLSKVTDNCKILTFSPWKIIDLTLTQAVSSWLNSDSNDDQRDSTLTRLIWVRVESNLTHDSWVEHNPGVGKFSKNYISGITKASAFEWYASFVLSPPTPSNEPWGAEIDVYRLSISAPNIVFVKSNIVKYRVRPPPPSRWWKIWSASGARVK